MADATPLTDRPVVGTASVSYGDVYVAGSEPLLDGDRGHDHRKRRPMAGQVPGLRFSREDRSGAW